MGWNPLPPSSHEMWLAHTDLNAGKQNLSSTLTVLALQHFHRVVKCSFARSCRSPHFVSWLFQIFLPTAATLFRPLLPDEGNDRLLILHMRIAVTAFVWLRDKFSKPSCLPIANPLGGWKTFGITHIQQWLLKQMLLLNVKCQQAWYINSVWATFNFWKTSCFTGT